MFEEKRKQQELMKANMVLHQKTIDERKRLKEKQAELKKLKKKPVYSAFGYTNVLDKTKKAFKWEKQETEIEVWVYTLNDMANYDRTSNE